MEGSGPESRGFVFATTGPQYTTLARRAARNLRLAMPAAQVDLFTDQPVEDDVFDVIHRLDDGFFRPKMTAIRRSRFDRTIYLDADVIVLTDVLELFDILDHCDLAGCQGWARSPDLVGTPEIPRCYPMLNAGLLVAKRSAGMASLMNDWEAYLRLSELKFDQGLLRLAMFHSGLRILVLPLEYNLIFLRLLEVWNPEHGAPRILHVIDLHKNPPGDPLKPFNVEEVLTEKQLRNLRRGIAYDKISVAGAALPGRAPLAGDNQPA